MAADREYVDTFMKGDFAQGMYRDFVNGDQGVAGKIEFTKKNLSPSQFKEFQSMMFHQMGLESKTAAEGAEKSFSAVALKRNWVNAQEEAKTALMGKNDEPLRKALDRWSKVGGQVDAVKALKEPSGSWYVAGGAEGAAAVIGYAASGSPGAAASMLLLPTAGFGAARLMTNARFVNWLADGAKPAALTAKGFASHMSKLAMIYEVEPSIRDALHEYMTEKKRIMPAPPPKRFTIPESDRVH
jgi:hypothetical protein